MNSPEGTARLHSVWPADLATHRHRVRVFTFSPTPIKVNQDCMLSSASGNHQNIWITKICKNIMFGVRFYPYAAGSFFQEDIEEFNNQVADYELIDNSAIGLHQQLHDAQSHQVRVLLLEEFLSSRLSITEKRKSKISKAKITFQRK